VLLDPLEVGLEGLGDAELPPPQPARQHPGRQLAKFFVHGAMDTPSHGVRVKASRTGEQASTALLDPD
jgi:hypothetical protein